MFERFFPSLAIALLLIGTPLQFCLGAGSEFADLTRDQRIADFRVEAVYENETGHEVGARFRHTPTGFVLDILRIQSLPQAFTWVNSLPPSDQGEPHTLEHLLLGKGNKGRYVASLEDMSLGSSSAFTQQVRTCYHFSTAAGTDIFFRLFEAKLDAMLNPNFSDEEIRREVCNMGIAEDQESGTLRLEEKGTVYNEMVSSYERPWANLFRELGRTLYGDTHPLALDSGGYPAAIREMTPADIRGFHAATHHLNNMGSVVSLSDDVRLEGSLEKFSEIFERVEPNAVAGEDPAALYDRIPPPGAGLPGSAGSEVGSIATTHFPHQNTNEPGLLMFAWPAQLDLDPQETFLLELFWELMSSGQTSNLYRAFIDSQTRKMDVGASNVFGWVSDEPGQPVYLGLSNIDPGSCDEETIEEIRSVVLGEIQAIAEMADGSDELRAFNERADNALRQGLRARRKFLNSPPRFGFRGTGSAWIDLLQTLNRGDGFRRNLAQVEERGGAEIELAGELNLWREHLAKWRMIESLPLAVASLPDPEMLEIDEKARAGRVADFISVFRENHDLASDEEAIKLYRDEYDLGTAKIDKVAAQVEMPEFIENPPLTLDDELDYEVDKLLGGIDLVTSTFDNMTSATTGIALRLNAVPESQLFYVAALPTLLTDVGVIKGGQPIAYNDFQELLRKEILSLDVYPSLNYGTERVELTIRVSGSARHETIRALDWMKTVLFHPDLREENLPRIRDAVDLALTNSRNRMRGSEESWVNTPMNAFWKQNNPLLLNAGCFLTQTHSLHRLRWLLKDADGAGEDLPGFFADVISFVEANGRDPFAELLSAIVDSTDVSGDDSLLRSYRSLSPPTRDIAREAAKDLRQSLSDLPDESLAPDIRYLCGQMEHDLAIAPAEALAGVRRVLDLIRHQDNARFFIIGNSSDVKLIRQTVTEMAYGLSPEPSQQIAYDSTPRISARARDRSDNKVASAFVGLVNENTRAGVHIHTADCADYKETDPEELLRFLAARLYGGGGAHSMFMKTWAAGLAYSNGLRSNEANGRMVYYAERCPDLTQTLQFVIDQLEAAPHDPSLGDYAVAQIFTGMRSGARYEQRGESMAADLADGITPEVVRSFRSSILELRKQEGFYDRIQSRMEQTYGEILPGYGTPAETAVPDANAIYFVIGPEKQMESWEDYLSSVEPKARLRRIYPRDYWIVDQAALRQVMD